MANIMARKEIVKARRCVSICPASEMRARLFVKRPPATSTTIIRAVRPAAAISRLFSLPFNRWAELAGSSS